MPKPIRLRTLPDRIPSKTIAGVETKLASLNFRVSRGDAPGKLVIRERMAQRGSVYVCKWGYQPWVQFHLGREDSDVALSVASGGGMRVIDVVRDLWCAVFATNFDDHAPVNFTWIQVDIEACAAAVVAMPDHWPAGASVTQELRVQSWGVEKYLVVDDAPPPSMGALIFVPDTGEPVVARVRMEDKRALAAFKALTFVGVSKAIAKMVTQRCALKAGAYHHLSETEALGLALIVWAATESPPMPAALPDGTPRPTISYVKNTPCLNFGSSVDDWTAAIAAAVDWLGRHGGDM